MSGNDSILKEMEETLRTIHGKFPGGEPRPALGASPNPEYMHYHQLLTKLNQLSNQLGKNDLYLPSPGGAFSMVPSQAREQVAKLSSVLDEIAGHLESKGLMKEARELDIVSNSIEAWSQS